MPAPGAANRASLAGQVVWRSLAAVRPDPPDGVQFWFGDDRFFGLCPAGDGWTYGFGTMSTERLREPVAGRARRLAAPFEGRDRAGCWPSWSRCPRMSETRRCGGTA